MLYFTVSTNRKLTDPIKLLHVTSSHYNAQASAGVHGEGFVVDRHALTSMEEAEEMARACNEWAIENKTGDTYIATDAGQWTHPRYDVIALPKLGAEVSYSFNGDCYPAGRITRISAAPLYKRIVATDEKGYEHVFFRVKQSGGWRKDRTWWLVPGRHHKLNPSF